MNRSSDTWNSGTALSEWTSRHICRSSLPHVGLAAVELQVGVGAGFIVSRLTLFFEEESERAKTTHDR